MKGGHPPHTEMCSRLRWRAEHLVQVWSRGPIRKRTEVDREGLQSTMSEDAEERKTGEA